MSIDAQAALALANSALQTVAQAFAEKDVALNALSLQADSLSAANVALQAQLDTANAAIVDLKAKLDALQPKPPAPKTVKDYGAVGDGVKDDTAAIQAAIDAGDGRVPAGRYVVDPIRSLNIGPGESLTLDADAVLIAKPNNQPRYAVVKIDSGTMTGGQVLGDRVLHTYSGTTTHEWGYGVQVKGTAAKVSGVRVSQCTGDGFGVSGNDHVFEDCVSTQNRRQGMSVFAVKSLRVSRCEFTKTGAYNGQAGTNPRCGVDIEPDSGWAEDVLFEDCTITDNDVTGFVAWIRQEVVGGVRGLNIRNCKIQGVNAVHMKALAGSISATLSGNTIKRGNGSGLRIELGALVNVDGNTFQQPTTRTAFSLTGTSTKTQYDINAISPGKAVVGTNRYE